MRFLYTSPPPKSYSDRAIVHVLVSELIIGIAISAVGVVGHRILGVAGGSSLQEEHRTDRGGCHDGDDKYDGDQLFLLRESYSGYYQ